MAALLQLAARPAPGVDPTARSKYRTVGLALALVGLMGATASVIANFVAADGISATDSYQATAGSDVQTLKMPTTAKVMLAFMMMGMMVMAAGIITNFVAAGAFNGTDPADIIDSASYGALGSGLRRLGVATYLTGIAFGLGTIIEVLRFQVIRLREVGAEHGHQH